MLPRRPAWAKRRSANRRAWRGRFANRPPDPGEPVFFRRPAA
ncbi:hypothetical protein BURMUCGD1_5081 [Burkholderia multivorans CGD1]|nr:hypothetical protein BURMUCGD1_5081 [Burkholderia multivorans CGD1]